MKDKTDSGVKILFLVPPCLFKGVLNHVHSYISRRLDATDNTTVNKIYIKGCDMVLAGNTDVVELNKHFSCFSHS
jgi:hypothetical protein